VVVTVGVVVVSYNSGQRLRSCLTSILAENPDGVVVVDNASQDGSADLVAAEFPGILLLRNDANLGFARAVNQALRRYRWDYTLLLNPDAILLPGTLPALGDILDRFEDVAGVGPAVYDPAGHLRTLSAGRQPSLWRLFTHYSGLSRLSAGCAGLEGWQLLRRVHDNVPRNVEWLSGAALLLRRRALDAVGLLSERWFMYFEDVDLGARLRELGWRLVHVPDVVVLHRGGASQAPEGPVDTTWVRSAKDYYRYRWHPGRLRDLAWRTVLAGGLATRSVNFQLRAVRGGREAAKWRRESRRFLAFAGEAWRRDS
jgi:GT2 family glycosyltransferase